MICAIYCRLSKEDEGKALESESIQNQKSLLINYALEKGWDIYKIYADDDYSGIDRDRPEFKAMLKDAECAKFELILCKTQSRFTRDMELVEKYIHHDFLLWGIRFVAVVDNVDTEVKGNKKARQINGLINEWYLEDLSDNIKTVFDHKRKQGEFIGSFASYGYLKDPNNHNKLLVDDEAANVVKRIFSLYLAGNGKQQIARILNEEDVANPTKYKRSMGFSYLNGSANDGMGLWNKTTVGRILKNEIYIGNMVQGKRAKLSYKEKTCADVPEADWIRVANTHEPIIEKAIFDRVQELMRCHTRSDGRGEVHLLAGKVFCADCGSILNKVKSGNKVESPSYLRCKLHIQKKDLCSSHYICLDQLLNIVEIKIREYIKEFYLETDIREFELEGKLINKSWEKDMAIIKSQIAKRTQAIKNLYLDKIDGIIDENQFCEFNAAFFEEKEKLTLKLAMLTAKENANTNQNNNMINLKKQLAELLEFKNVDRELVCLLIDSIEVWEKDKKTGEQHICINWLI